MVKAEMDRADARRLTKAFGQLSALTGKPMQDILKQHGRLLAVDAAKFTKRFGTKASAGKRHKVDVRTSILSTYIRPLAVAKLISIKFGEKKGRKFASYIKGKNISKAQSTIDQMGFTIDGQRVLVGVFDGGRLHRERLKGKYKSKLCVLGFKDVTAYMQKKLKEVGELKAGWAKAAEMLGGTRGIPAYAKKAHHKTKGKGKVTGKNSKADLEVTNYSDYMFHSTSMSKLLRLRAKKIEKVVNSMIARKSKKRARKV